MTDEQIVKGLRCWAGKIVKDEECAECAFGEDCSLGEIVDAAENRINELAAENAALRERLEKAVELPVKTGDKVYMPWVYGGESGIAECEVYHISLFKDRYDGSLIVTDLKSDNIDFKREYNYGQFMLRDFGVKVFTTRKAAEARLEKLKGGEHE